MSLRKVASAAAAALAFGILLAPPSAAVTTAAPTELFTYTDPQINESSGIAASSFDGTFYTHNDSGDSARFFRVDGNGDTTAVYTLRGATNVDWEDMATAPDGAGGAGGRVLYFGDIGDNNRVRKEIAVYAVPEPHGPTGDVAWTRYRFAYPDGAHDAEALLVDPRSHRIYIATKELLSNGKIYAAPSSLSTTGVNVLTPVGGVPPLTTSADFAPDGSRVVVLTYLGAFWADASAFSEDDGGAAWHRFDVFLPRQAEAIAYDADGSSVLVGGEGAHSTVYRAPVPAAEVETPRSSAAAPPPSVPPSAPSGALSTHRSSGPPTGVVIFIPVAAAMVAGLLLLRRRRNR